ncbi:MAG: HD domain-containing phosphohydrolase [Candidatus Omnitrophota bacterium]
MENNATLTSVLRNLRIANNIAAGFSLIDRNYTITWCNIEQRKWFGVNKEIFGKHCYEIYEKRSHPCKGCPCKKAFKNGKVYEAIRPGILKDGKRHFFKVIANPIKDKNNKVIQILELVQEVTDSLIERKRILHLEKMCNRLKNVNRKLNADRIRLRSIFRNTRYIKQNLTKQYRNLLKKLKYTNEELRDMFTVSKAISSNGDTSKTISLITKLTKQLIQADVVTVRFVDEEKGMLIPKAAVGINKEVLIETPLKIGQSIEGAVAKNSKLLFSKDMQSDERVLYKEEVKRENLHSAIFVPAIFNKQCLAVIAAFYHRVRKFKEEEISALKTFASHVAIAIQETKNYDDVHRNYFNTLKALVLAMEARDPYTQGHSERVTHYAIDIAKKLNLSDSLIDILRYAGIVHDVGKIGISDLILNKPGRLTSAERLIIELHPIKGAEMLEPLKFMKTGIPLVRHHHERFDGLGYPDRIAGEEIPLSARIIACADSFDAMTSDRPYRLKRMTVNEAIVELKANSGSQFDPKIVPIFINLIKKEKYI